MCHTSIRFTAIINVTGMKLYLHVYIPSNVCGQELAEVVCEFSDAGNKGPNGRDKVLYDDFVDMLVVGSPRFDALASSP